MTGVRSEEIFHASGGQHWHWPPVCVCVCVCVCVSVHKTGQLLQGSNHICTVVHVECTTHLLEATVEQIIVLVHES